MDTIYDPLRRKNVARTPEEEVRQWAIAWLRDTMGIPEVRMQSEYAFEYNGLSYRADILTFDRNLNPEILVECKAPSVELDRNVTDQITRYSRVLNVKRIIITNGRETKTFVVNQ